jgi:uncharacterized membrane protein (DUF373 family)
MTRGPEPTRWSVGAGKVFLHIEHAAYVLLGLLLAGAAAVALLHSVSSLTAAVLDWGADASLLQTIDQLLFVFMLIEIMHTVRASLRDGGLSCEPFLVVGLIASIRRVLVITLQTSQATKGKDWSPDIEAMLRSSMMELGVMAVLILAMVVSIFLLHRARPAEAGPAGQSLESDEE